MLEELVKSRTRLKLLKLFLMEREREFYLRELGRLTGENLNSLRLELRNLAKAGIIAERRSGNQKLYRADRSCPVHEELRRLVIKTVGLGDAIRVKLTKLGGVKYALIFGSFASGEEVAESDIDLLMIGDVDEEQMVETVRNLEEEMSREINYILWNSKEFQRRTKKRHHLLLEIVEKPFMMLIGDKDEFRKAVER